MPIPDDERSINESHATTFHPRTPQADGPDQIADATVIYFDHFDNVCRIDNNDINAVEQAESSYQDARR